jgi:predicted nucleic acid-binding protein
MVFSQPLKLAWGAILAGYSIYLDVCCLNRPFDDQNQDRIRLEAEAVILILNRLQANDWSWYSSDAILYEIDQTPDLERRRRVKVLVSAAHEVISLTPTEIDRAKELQTRGFKQWDALHLACAESSRVDIFLTTDDKLLRLAQREMPQLRVQVANPLNWLTEVMK